MYATPTTMTPSVPVLRDRSDEYLLARVREGDAVAMRIVFDRHAPAVHRLVFQLLGSSDDADDVVQDVFVGLRIALAHYTERGNFEGWLKRVAVRAALMRLRGERRREAAVLVAPTPENTSTERDVGLQHALSAAVAGLPPQLRTVFVLRMVEDHSYEEIADLLGTTVGACKVRLHRALRQLRPLLVHLRRD